MAGSQFSVSQQESSTKTAVLENALDIKVIINSKKYLIAVYEQDAAGANIIPLLPEYLGSLPPPAYPPARIFSMPSFVEEMWIFFWNCSLMYLIF